MISRSYVSTNFITGLRSISKLDIFNKNHNLENYLSNIELEDDHFLFIGIPDYHWAFDDLGYTNKGEKKSYEITKKSFDLIFERFNKDDFDHIFIFSDHGFKFNYEILKEPKELLLNDDRTNIIMIHREKKQNNIVKNDKLCSLADMYATYCDILALSQDKGISLFSNKERDFVIAEDHLNFAPSVNQNIELWSLINKETIYIRTLEKAILIDRKTLKYKKGFIDEFDELLKHNSSFRIYFDEYEKVFKYIKNIRLDSNERYLNNSPRMKKNIILKRIELIVDYILNIVR